MKKFNLLIAVVICNCTFSIAQNNIKQLIIGKWKPLELTMRCDEIKGFNQAMENPLIKDALKPATQVDFQFNNDNTLTLTSINNSGEPKSKTFPYKFKDNDILFNADTIHIVTVSEYTLEILFAKMKSNDEMFEEALDLLNAKNDTDKTVQLIYSYYKVKEMTLFEANFDKSKTEQLILGQWKGISLDVQCTESKTLAESLNNPMVKSMFENSNKSSLLEFSSDKILISGESDTNKYSLKNDSLTFYFKEQNFFGFSDSASKEKLKKMRIVYLDEDSLVIRHNRNTNDPELLVWFGMMSKNDDIKNKTITYTEFYSKVKEAKAPWTLIANNLPKQKPAVNLITYDNNLLCILKAPLFAAGDYDSILFSNVESKNWTSFSNAVPIKQFDNLSLAYNNKRIFVAAGQSGLYWSDNSQKPFLEVKGIKDPKLFAFDKNNVLVSAGQMYDSELYHSKDNGTNWKPLKKISQAKSYDINAIAIKGSFIIAGGNTDDYGLFLMFSTDEGESWSSTEETFKDYMGIMPTSLLILGNSIYMDTQYGWFISKDDGIKWEKISNIMPGGKITLGGSLSDLSIARTETCVFMSNSEGVFLSSDDGSSWKEVNNKELRKGVTSLAIIDSSIFALTPGNNIWKASINELLGPIQNKKK